MRSVPNDECTIVSIGTYNYQNRRRSFSPVARKKVELFIPFDSAYVYIYRTMINALYHKHPTKKTARTSDRHAQTYTPYSYSFKHPNICLNFIITPEYIQFPTPETRTIRLQSLGVKTNYFTTI